MYASLAYPGPARTAGIIIALLLVLLLITAASADALAHDNVQLTDGSNCNHPSWSPDGKKLVFAFDQAIWIMNSDGSGKKKLYDNLAWEGDPVFDHNGSRIYYATESKKAFSGRYISIQVMDVSGENVLKLTETADSRYPAVSPDGTRIAYVSRIAGNYDVWVMDLDGSNNVRITDSKGDESSPSWSPDGSRLLYSLEGDILVQAIDSAEPVVLLSNSYDNVEPAYSPDGENIVFASDQGGDYDIWVMGADGKGFTMLTSASASERAPAWSPDGSKIAYVSNEGEGYNVWSMSLSNGVAEFEYAEEEEAYDEPGKLNPFLDRIRLFATENPRTFILCVLILSFVIVSSLVYSFLRKIR
ncbi:MAG: PD40 domain-containing protein [Methanosarcinaceae archaeon]|nr:PD40 domain-containing protein [Methanosarcinaceae archaeon]